MSINKRNSEGYFDPTAYEALTKIARDAKQARAYRPLIYVCSPLSGDISANQENARRYCRSVVERGGIPLAPHLLFPQFMDDTSAEERDLAIFMDIVLLSRCDQLWVFGERISKGMSMEIEKAKRKGQPIRGFDFNCREVFQ